MKKQIDIVLESLTEGELVESLAQSVKHFSDLSIYGQSIINANSPFGRIMEAQQADEAATCATP